MTNKCDHPAHEVCDYCQVFNTFDICPFTTSTEQENERLKLLLIDCLAELKTIDWLVPTIEGLLERIERELNV